MRRRARRATAARRPFADPPGARNLRQYAPVALPLGGATRACHGSAERVTGYAVGTVPSRTPSSVRADAAQVNVAACSTDWADLVAHSPGSAR